MKRLLTAATIGMIALAMAASSNAAPPSPAVAALQRRVTSDTRRIHNLEQRRTYLHRFIRHMRHTWSPPVARSAPTAPAAPAVASYTGGVLSAAQVASYARAAGFPESAIPQMVAYAYRESHFDPGAINASSGACGIWQIWPAQPNCTNPATNAALAYEKYRAAGYAPWGG